MTDRMEVQNLYKIFGKSPARAMAMLNDGRTKTDVLVDTGAVVGLNDVSLRIPAGGITMIMGLSGSGKSTLARCLNRLNEPTAGRILLDGEDIVPFGDRALREVRRSRITMVFQHFALLPNRSIIENVEFGLKLRGVARTARRARAQDVLEVVGLDRWTHHLPHELSGGMRQRVGLARALATDADLLIMDEAFSALDPLIRAEMQDELLRLQRVLRKTIVFITHDFQEALKLGSHVAIMADGRVEAEGTPQSIVLDPASDYVAAFTRDIDRSRLFDARSAMSQARPMGAGNIFGCDDAAFVVDGDARVIGTLSRDAVERVRAGGDAHGLMDDRFVAVPCSARLIDLAARFGAGRPLAVVDADGRLVGTLCAEQVLARIATIPAPRAPEGQHA